MPVFKLFFKLVRSMKVSILLYIGIFIVIFACFNFYVSSQFPDYQDFEATKVNIAILDEDNSDFSKQVEQYLQTESNVREYENEEVTQDALFYQDIVVIVRIPNGFASAFQEGKEVLIEVESLPDASQSELIKQNINGYLGKVASYHKTLPQLTLDEIHEQIMQDMSETAEVSMVNNQTITNSTTAKSMYFNYLTYIFLALFTSCGAFVLMRLFKKEIRMRNLMAPISTIKFNLQILYASLLCSIALWLLFMVIVVFMNLDIFNMNGFLYAINALAFIFVAMSFSFLIATIFAGSNKSEDAVSGASNAITLSSCFLCGAFIPQSVLSESILKIASFNPAYWYIKNNELLTLQPEGGDELLAIFMNFGIIIAFACCIFLVGLVISKHKQSSKAI